MCELERNRRSARQDRIELEVGEPHVAFENYRQDGAKIGGDREIAPLVELRRGEARPVAVNAAAIDRASQQPDDIAVAVIRAAIAVLAHGAAEFG